MTRTKIAFLYSLFAAISIAANIGTQKLYLVAAPVRLAVPLSVLAGTAVGLGIKFVLDKLWIFEYRHRDIAHGIRSFILYSAMGIATTTVFWVFEFAADRIFGTEIARLLGGTVGLLFGYAVKYRLDKQFVFS